MPTYTPDLGVQCFRSVNKSSFLIMLPPYSHLSGSHMNQDKPNFLQISPQLVLLLIQRLTIRKRKKKIKKTKNLRENKPTSPHSHMAKISFPSLSHRKSQVLIQLHEVTESGKSAQQIPPLRDTEIKTYGFSSSTSSSPVVHIRVMYGCHQACHKSIQNHPPFPNSHLRGLLLQLQVEIN